jgi:Flp pilus assembly protein TadB
MIRRIRRGGAFALSILVLFTLLMPWMSIKCDGEKLITYNAFDLTVGSGFEEALSEMQSGTDNQPGTDTEIQDDHRVYELFAVLALAAAGLLSLFLTWHFRVALACAGVAALLILQVRVRWRVSELNAELGVPLLGVGFEIGYWLALLGFIAMAVLQFYPWRGQSRRRRRRR